MLISAFVYGSELHENVLHDWNNHRILVRRSPFSQAFDLLSISYVLQQVGSRGSGSDHCHIIGQPSTRSRFIATPSQTNKT